MSLSRYTKATIPNRFTVLGVVLHPFSVGHYLLLSRFGSPFISEEAFNVTLRSIIRSQTDYDQEYFAYLVFMLMICSHSYEDNIELLSDSELMFKEQQLFNHNISLYIKNEKQKEGGLNLRWELSKLRQYIQIAFDVPKWSFSSSNANPKAPPNKHWSEQLIEDVITKGNRKRTEVMNMHLAELWLAWAHIAEDLGHITMLTEEQERAVEEGTAVVTVEEGGWEKLLAEYEKKHGKVT